MSAAAPELTLGPNLFNWAPETWRDFYFRIADEAPVSVVYLGETICSKRAPMFTDHYEKVAERLAAAGKTVVHSTLGETASKIDRRLVSGQLGRADSHCRRASTTGGGTGLPGGGLPR